MAESRLEDTAKEASVNPIAVPDKRPIRRIWAFATALAAVGLVVAGWVVYEANAPHLKDIAKLEVDPKTVLPSDICSALRWDVAFILGYGGGLALGLLCGLWTSHSKRAREAVRVGFIGAAVVVVCDGLEDLFLALATRTNSGVNTWHQVASGFSIVKWSLLIPTAAISLTGVVQLCWRCLANTPRELERAVEKYAPIQDEQLKPLEGSNTWGQGYYLADEQEVIEGAKGSIGFCLSGGGIRAGSVALGFLQQMRDELSKARYLVSVSGGGYTAGAFVQALTDAPQAAMPQGWKQERDANKVYAPGSVEEDHIRRHSSYLADTVPLLLVALGLILRHLLLSLVVLFGPAVVLGVAFGGFYATVPVTDLSKLLGHTSPSKGYSTPFPDFRVEAWVAIGALTMLALVLWLASLRRRAVVGRPNRLLSASRAVAWGAGIVIGVAVVIPTLVFAASWILSQFSGSKHFAIGGPIVGVVVSYLATIGAVAWRSKKTIMSAVSSGTGSGDKGSSITAAIPTGVTQRLLVGLSLLILAAGWLTLFAGAILTNGKSGAWISAGVVALIVIWLGVFQDETSLSMHPYYRQRLATAFASRVLTNQNGACIAQAYPPAEVTSLDKYGKPAPEKGSFPEVIFAAAATISGTGQLPPGRSTVSYTFNADWVGGPAVGWVRTKDLIAISPPRLQRDLTVQGAVALSGAAFASAMGKGARWFQVMLAITGARLGAWMPNPGYLETMRVAAEKDDWTWARLPRARRLTYLLSEIANVHPHGDRLLEVTDGGHYDNLGLIELLRRRCQTIYCIDGSGDSPPTAATFAEALTRAHDELGVTFTPDPDVDLLDMEPGTGAPLDVPTLKGLDARLSKRAVISGTFTYPKEAGLDGWCEARLVFAKALLLDDVPYDLLSYAAKNEVFPHDSTADQWFDAGQFAAYTELGRILGNHAMPQKNPPPAGP